MENRARIEQNDKHFLTEFAQLQKCQKGPDFAPWLSVAAGSAGRVCGPLLLLAGLAATN
eukprot:COSAG06_NODE_2303_length_7118_cov_4.980339_10_plen_59_part_00